MKRRWRISRGSKKNSLKTFASCAYTGRRRRFFVCRKYGLIGAILIAGGVGMLISLLLDNVFLSILFGAGLIVGGVLLLGSAS